MLGIGGGGFAGNVRAESAADGLGRGYAVIQNDLGHASASALDPSFAVDERGRRNVEGIVALCSPKYYEDNGNGDPSDDYGYVDLRTRVLPETFERLKEVRLEIEVKDIRVDKKKAHADLRFIYQAKMALPSGEKWHADTELNRVELEQEDDGAWKIIRGL